MENTTPSLTLEPFDPLDSLSSQTPPTPKPNNILVITLSVLLATAIGTGSYYFLEYQKLKSTRQPVSNEITVTEPTSSPNPAIMPEYTVSINPVSKWQKYTLPSFTIDIPPDWPIDQYKNTNPYQFFNYTPSVGRDFDKIADKGKLKLEIYTDVTGKTLDEYIDYQKSQYKNSSTWEQKSSIIDGQLAVKIMTDFGTNYNVVDPTTNQVLSLVFGLDFPNYQNLSDQILSTFKFTDQTNTLPTPPGSIRYTSEKLGVSFYYQEKQGDETFSAKEIGNKIYVHSNISPPDQGQYVEVFEKSASDTLVDAIKKTVLAGYSQTDCVIDKNSISFSTSQINPSFETVSLTVEVEGERSLEKLVQKAASCPSRYMAIGGLNYFLADPTHPSTFLFVSIGQYAIQGDHEKLWQDTLEFIDY